MFFGFLKPSPPFLLLGDGLSLLLGDLLGWFCSSDCFPACLNLRFTERACIKQMTAWIRAVVYFALALTLFTGQIDVPTLFTGQIDSLIVDDMFDRVETYKRIQKPRASGIEPHNNPPVDVSNAIEAFGNSHETDKQALLKFKSQVSVEKKFLLSSWNNSFPLCRWTGVTCGRKHKRVTDLDLGGFQLGGMISPFIGNLSFLMSLNFSDNSFGGTIPQELGNLFRIEHLLMPFNLLSGGIPAKNNLEGEIPDAIARLTQMVETFLLSLGKCSYLLDLRIENNKLTGIIPQEIMQIPTLVSVGMSNNLLTNCLPEDVGRLESLVGLSVAHNKLYGKLPKTLGKCLSMEKLGLQGNSFEGIIPDISGLVGINFWKQKSLWRRLGTATTAMFYTTTKKVKKENCDWVTEIFEMQQMAFLRETFINQLSSAGVRGSIGYAAPDESILHNGLRIGFPAAECLTKVLEVGLRCSEESPANRLEVSEVVKELISIKERALALPPRSLNYLHPQAFITSDNGDP
ncbi:hypothetical protein Bca52824_043991 [Brassica carinata]|uniref:Leucine-rich repeat-containing N-terminal plant-type domain-containing protein n=1 Tax=Brassica carinata TaxID=52824 RepID=A0A8X7S072_BRACI|nr:hypothetical protein Bca52824_043991 [Brassica carinata]